MDSIINELYNGKIRSIEQMGRHTPETKAILKRMHENEEKLEMGLDEQKKALLHTIQDERFEVDSILLEKRFREAFTLGARIMVEMLTGCMDQSWEGRVPWDMEIK